jgi:hypothetical protein
MDKKTKIEILDKAVKFACDYYGVSRFKGSVVYCEDFTSNTNGVFDNDTNEIFIYAILERDIDGLLRTLFHEMIHYFQSVEWNTLRFIEGKEPENYCSPGSVTDFIARNKHGRGGWYRNVADLLCYIGKIKWEQK